MRVWIQYPNTQYSGDFFCDDIQFVPGFIVLKNAKTPPHWDSYHVIPQWALPTQTILEIRVYDA